MEVALPFVVAAVAMPAWHLHGVDRTDTGRISAVASRAGSPPGHAPCIFRSLANDALA